MPALTRQQKITFGGMRASGVRGVLVYCSDYRCNHSIAMSADRWPDDVRLAFAQSCGMQWVLSPRPMRTETLL
jgi:hypothetical protein